MHVGELTFTDYGPQKEAIQRPTGYMKGSATVEEFWLPERKARKSDHESYYPFMQFKIII